MAINGTKLLAAINASKKLLRPFVEKYEGMVKEYRGSEYGDTDLPPSYINLMHQGADTYTQVLAANRPRALITSQFKELRWFAQHFQRSLNNHIKEIRLEEELRLCVLNAYFLYGPMKVYYGEDAEIKLEGTDTWVDPGRPYAEHIPPEDFGFDMQAKSWKKITFSYDEYVVDRNKVLADPAFAKARKILEDAPSVGALHERSSEITEFDPDLDFESSIKLRDVWLPRRNMVVTQIVTDKDNSENASGEIVREIPWEGPAAGPHRVLTFSDTPGSIIGVSPAMNTRILSGLVNSLYRKQVNQARRQRDIPIFESDAEDDAHRIEGAGDGRWTRVQRREGVDVLKLGGVDPSNAVFTENVIAMHDRMAGNLQSMAGLGPGAETLGQDQIIQQQTGKRQAKMQSRVVDFATDILRDLGWLLWNDQQREIQNEYEIPGTGIMTTSVWSPDHRDGKFMQYNFEVEPFSLPYKSPSERAQGLLTYVTQIAAPMMQMIQQQGGQIDFKDLTEYYSELMDLPRLKDVVEFQAGQEAQLQPQPEPPPGAPVTTRTNIRRDAPQQPQNPMQEALGQMAAQQPQQMQPMMPGANHGQ